MKLGWLLLALPLVLFAQEDSKLPYYRSGFPWKREYVCQASPLPPAPSPPPAVSYSPAPKPWMSPVSLTRTGTATGGMKDSQTYTLRFFDFGSVTGGPYAGARLLLSKFYFLHEYEGDREKRAGVQYQRYLLKDNRLIRLPLLSETPDDPGVFSGLLKQLKVDAAQEDRNFRLAVFEKPVPNVSVKNLCLTFWEQLPEELAGERRVPVGPHPLYGQFYLLPHHQEYVHAQLPDGTVLTYYLLPPAELDNPAEMGKGPFSCFNRDYFADKNGGLTGPAADVLYLPDTTLNEMRPLRELARFGKVYVSRNQGPKESYADYRETWKTYFANPEPGSKLKKVPMLTAAQYAASVPEFFWRDPLGRWILFLNTSVRFAMDAEPLIYLYPQTSQMISVRLASQLQILWADPPLAGHTWQVDATPTGLMTSGGAKFGSLFWEGKWVPLAPPESGFVVPRENLETFFTSTLGELGLNERESYEFQRYWIPRMQGHPYYMIAFLDRETIDTIAPLEITPAPDTFIRILMDFVAFDQPVALPSPSLPPKPARRGFVAVEWGGMYR